MSLYNFKIASDARQVGFLVCVKQGAVNRAETDFKHICSSEEEGHSYYKSAEMNELDSRIGDLDGFIKDTEKMIISELEDNILD